MSNMASTNETPEPHLVLHFFAKVRGIKDTQIAGLLEIHRNTVPRKRNGEIPLIGAEIDVLAKAFGVPRDVFEMTGRQAVQWATEERPAWFEGERPSTPPDDDPRVTKLADKLRSPAGVVQWESGDILLEAA